MATSSKNFWIHRKRWLSNWDWIKPLKDFKSNFPINCEILNRFAQEYLIREEQALAFKQANYQGDIPRQIAAITVPSGMDAKTATDLIIEQAELLREAINKIGELRMRAYELQTLTTELEINDRAAQIVLEIRKVAEVLA